MYGRRCGDERELARAAREKKKIFTAYNALYNTNSFIMGPHRMVICSLFKATTNKQEQAGSHRNDDACIDANEEICLFTKTIRPYQPLLWHAAGTHTY